MSESESSNHPEAQGQRWATIGLGAAIVGLAVFLAVKGGGSKTASSLADAGPDALATTSATASATPEADASDLTFDRLAAIGRPEAREDDRADAGGIGSRMPDGTPVPPLPEKSPKAVRFGAILVTYAGASQAPPTARPKKDAEELARKLAADAKTDFHAAVTHGDSGSGDDLGRMPRGMLELGVEYALFTLAPGQVSEPVDTPRGFWIMKRID